MEQNEWDLCRNPQSENKPDTGNTINSEETADHSSSTSENNHQSSKKVSGAIILLIIRELAAFGHWAEEALHIMADSGIEQNMDAIARFSAMIRLSLVGVAIELGIIALTTISIPLLWRLIRKKRLPYKSGKILCFCISFIVAFIIPWVFKIEVYTFSYIDAIIMYFVNKWFFVENKPAHS